jgi:hypothetical protein
MRLILGFWTWTAGALVDYFATTRDMNTAMLLYLNSYYGTSYADIQAPLARYLREGTANVQAQYKQLERRARGIST